MNEEHLAKVNSNSKSKEKIQLSKWREQACFWRQNSNYHRKWREQACFSMFSRWRQISNSNRMRNICRNGARSEADLAQCGALALPPPFLFFVAVGANFFQRPLVWGNTEESFFQNIRSGDSPSYAVGDALWQLERTPSRSDFLKFAQAKWTRTYLDNASARAALFTCVQSRKAKFYASDSYNSPCACSQAFRHRSQLGWSCYLLLEQSWLWVTTYLHPVYAKPWKRLASGICSD